MAFPGIQELIAAAGPQIKDVEFEFKGVKQTLHIRQLSFREAGALNARLIGADGKVEVGKVGAFRENMIASTLCDADGKPACTADEVGSFPVSLVDELEKVVRVANGLTDTEASADAKNS